ncbi:heparan sulfate 2-O-sulfotransferase 1-like [Dendronephthya gigantea]|uniref:heparan sulfate 2-O-sulfotransferase 1-like n=1 Tax=Dendronephthya gigantea TaxID=151771 RepID=UPI00106A0349|nr:heparan sulfate 2-O-sulfotransferase 1-like [Dendronephthya gigantea]
MNMFWRNNTTSKLLLLSFAVGIFVILEVQIQRLQTQVLLLSRVPVGHRTSIGFEEDMNENNPKIENLVKDGVDEWQSEDDGEEDIDETHFSIGTSKFEMKIDKTMLAPAGERTIIFYNRVPKTGSTSFMGVLYALCTKNSFHVIHLNVSKNNHVMGIADQIRFAKNVTTWTAKMPAFYHGHQSFIDFGKLGFEKKPLYINIVRKPLERLVSYYYFLRNGDDFRPGLKRARQGNQESFDECIIRRHRDCQMERLWIQIPFFCGQHPDCWEPGNAWALQKAKENLVNNYLVVGVTERLTEFVAVMEVVLPRFFKGATKRFILGGRSHLRKTFAKKELKPETLEYFHKSKVWQMEYEFYLFANRTFTSVLKRTFVRYRGKYLPAKRKFYFEKIRPRPKESR